MRRIDENEVNRCLLCVDAPCSKACLHNLAPDNRIRSLYFSNPYGATADLDNDLCSSCKAPCEKACILNLQNHPIAIARLMKEAFALKREIEFTHEEPNLSTSICGIPLENPFLLSSSSVSSNYEMVAKAFDLGWAGVSFKTICLFEQHEASPRFSVLRARQGTFFGFKNIEQLSTHTLEENLTTLKQLKENYPNKFIMASIMGRSEEEWEYLARVCSEAGADAIECNYSCPNMEDGALGQTIGQSEDLVRRYTIAARKGTNKPLMVKLTPNITDMVPIAKVAKESGADGVSAINTINSITGINWETLTPYPAVRGLSSIGGYSGKAVKPIALGFITNLAECEELKGMQISGMGGIENWRDALEFILLGAGSVQVTTAVMQYGYRIIDDLIDGLTGYMKERNIASVKELIGASLDNVVKLEELERDTILYPKFNYETCIGCGRCSLACYDGGHQAITFNTETRRPQFNATKCVGCHLCKLVCPVGSIGDVGKRVVKKK